LALDEAVVSVERRDNGGFHVATGRRNLECEKVIVTTGGKSYPGCGTTGDGYQWLAALGHTIRRPRPALVPLTSDEPWIHELAGVTIPDVLLRVIDPAAAESAGARKRRRGSLPAGVLIERRGSLLFTHFGLSGPAVLDVSRAVTAVADPGSLVLAADFLPGTSVDELDEWLRVSAASDGRKQVASLVFDPLPRSLIQTLVTRAGVPLNRRASELTKAERAAVVAQFKRCEIGVTGSRGFDKAEVTAGGVALDEVDSRTMQSKLVPNLFLAGEILDLDGFIGGYNFQAAFSTGWLAGESV
jgi:predicted Rossmann fold flavoprotein